MKNLIRRRIAESIQAKSALLGAGVETIARSASVISKALSRGGKVLIFGNGGSAADSQHFVAEFVGRFKKERRALAAIALTTNTSSLTAIANDYGYDEIFSRQIEALGKKGDVAIGISTSGNSPNVIKAILKARAIGMPTIALLGGTGGKLKKIADISIIAHSDATPRIQESHLLIEHIICELVEDEACRKRTQI